MQNSDTAIVEGDSVGASFADHVYQRWSSVRCFSYGLKIAWASVTSVVLGALLFFIAPQVQDLFLEVTGSFAASAVFWLSFYVAVMVAWALPVYVSSRWVLSRFEEGSSAAAYPDVEPVQTWVRRAIPPILAVACFGAVLIGQLMALSNAPSIIDQANATFDDLIAELFDSNQKVAEVCGSGTSNVLTCDIWVFPLLASKSIAAVAVKALGSGVVILIIYSILAVALLWFYLRYRLISWSFNVGRVGGKIIWWLVSPIVFVPLLLLVPTAWHFFSKEWPDPLGLMHLAVLPGLTLVAGYIAWLGLRPSPEGTATPIGYFLLRVRDIRGVVDEATANSLIVRPLFYAVLVCSLVLMALTVVLHPVHTTEYVNRVRMLPFLLGFLVAPTTYIGHWSVRCRAPLILTLVLILATATLVWRDTNDVRTVSNSLARDDLQESIDRWAQINDCEPGTSDPVRKCPSPLIVSAAGGASRSAFHVAGVIGRLMDETLGTIQKGHSHWIVSAAFSPDGKRVVTTALHEPSARLWDAKTGKEIAVLEGDWLALALKGDTARLSLVSAMFSRDGQRVVTASWDKTARIWDMATGKVIRVLRGHTDALQSAEFSPDGRRVLTVGQGEDDTVRLWDAETGKEIAVLEGADVCTPHMLAVTQPSRVLPGRPLCSEVYRVEFSPDSMRVITVAFRDDEATARLWDAVTGKEVAVLKGHPDRVLTTTFSPDGGRVVTVVSDKARTTKAASRSSPGVEKWEEIVLKGHPDHVGTAAFSPDGKRLVTMVSGTPRIWQPASRSGLADETWEVNAVLKGHKAGLRAVAFSPDGKRVVTASSDQSALLWDAATGNVIDILKGHTRIVTSASFSHDGKRIVTTSRDEAARVWDGETGNLLAVLGRYSESWRLRPFAKQLFAISAVSGGALGAVVTYAALADTQRPARATNGMGSPPCGKDGPDEDWFAPQVKYEVGSGPVWKPHESWRGCLQLLLSGDFLSPVFISLVTTDPVHYRGNRGDRAAVIEQSWEMRYGRLTGRKQEDSTLGASLLALRSEVLAREGNWLPILLLNGTSVTTGRRIVTSDIDTFKRDGNGYVANRIFRDAYDLHELLELRTNGAPDLRDAFARPTRDIRFSTAATMSARFPVISPHGNILGSDGRTIDRVVDGGYFENFGAVTATELARELESRGLEPFIILINNEPTTSGIECIRRDSALEHPKAPGSTWFASLGSPVNTVLATRQARGTHAAVELCSLIGDHNRFAFITVQPDPTNRDKALSMSWWLSKHVQRYLDAQLDPAPNTDNDIAFMKVRAARKLERLE